MSPLKFVSQYVRDFRKKLGANSAYSFRTLQSSSLVQIPGLYGIWFDSGPAYWTGVTSGFTLDVTAEYTSTVGRIFIPGGGTKVISAAGGGSILWFVSSATFVNASTTCRIGIQDIDASGIPDGTFDVYAEYTGVSDPIPVGRITTTMEVGSKVLTNGDIISMVASMPVRGGSDQVTLSRPAFFSAGQGTINFPYNVNTGSKSSLGSSMIGTITFDDGTTGWIDNTPVVPNMALTTTSFSYAQNSSPDEYANCFKLPFTCTINEVKVNLGSVNTTDNFEVVIYSDPFGTPTVIQTVAVDPFITGSISAFGVFMVPIKQITIQPNTWYAVAARPTTNNSISFLYLDYAVGGEKYKITGSFGLGAKVAGRTNQTGAFVETQVYHCPFFGVLVNQILR